MASIKRHKILFDSSSASTGDWIALDVRYDISTSRAIQVELVAGDTITIQGITADEKGIDKSFLDDLTDEDITGLRTYTASEADNLYGPWTYIRVVKTGTAGNARVQGFV